MITTSGDRIRKAKKWGWEDWVTNTQLYCGKVLFVRAGAACSYHRHVKSEHILVFEGSIKMKVGVGEDDHKDTKEFIMGPGDCIHIESYRWHQFEGITDATLIEFSTQHREADVERMAL